MISEFYNRPFPIIDINEHFHLREHKAKDTESFFEYYTDSEVCRHILATIPNSVNEAAQEIQYCKNLFYQRRGAYWALADKSENCMIGAIGLYINNQHHRAEICYDLKKEYWRKGLMSKAILSVIQYAFSQMHIFRIEALTVASNEASTGILQKLGFLHESTLKNYRYFKNQPHDVEMYGITPEALEQHLVKLRKKELIET